MAVLLSHIHADVNQSLLLHMFGYIYYMAYDQIHMACLSADYINVSLSFMYSCCNIASRVCEPFQIEPTILVFYLGTVLTDFICSPLCTGLG